ncbi:13445_t:CDS:2 [Ambispora leptoticha]|uniref:13445_t:CDS:1 n=1 Tax=Ambispora leptoticha TaxID=144679 RepID=A0A9N9G5F6_9GLOM|nr:13445_t:CDS:2 [Ambispora leptoticha]
MSEPLPQGWFEYYDPKTGRNYYESILDVSQETGQTTWYDPRRTPAPENDNKNNLIARQASMSSSMHSVSMSSPMQSTVTAAPINGNINNPIAGTVSMSSPMQPTVTAAPINDNKNNPIARQASMSSSMHSVSMSSMLPVSMSSPMQPTVTAVPINGNINNPITGTASMSSPMQPTVTAAPINDNKNNPIARPASMSLSMHSVSMSSMLPVSMSSPMQPTVTAVPINGNINNPITGTASMSSPMQPTATAQYLPNNPSSPIQYTNEPFAMSPIQEANNNIYFDNTLQQQQPGYEYQQQQPGYEYQQQTTQPDATKKKTDYKKIDKTAKKVAHSIGGLVGTFVTGAINPLSLIPRGNNKNSNSNNANMLQQHSQMLSLMEQQHQTTMAHFEVMTNFAAAQQEAQRMLQETLTRIVIAEKREQELNQKIAQMEAVLNNANQPDNLNTQEVTLNQKVVDTPAANYESNRNLPQKFQGLQGNQPLNEPESQVNQTMSQPLNNPEFQANQPAKIPEFQVNNPVNFSESRVNQQLKTPEAEANQFQVNQSNQPGKTPEFQVNHPVNFSELQINQQMKTPEFQANQPVNMSDRVYAQQENIQESKEIDNQDVKEISTRLENIQVSKKVHENSQRIATYSQLSLNAASTDIANSI